MEACPGLWQPVSGDAGDAGYIYSDAAITGMHRTYLVLTIVLAGALLCAGCTTQQPAVQQPVLQATPSPALAVTTPTLPAGITGNWVLTRMGVQGGSALIYPTVTITMQVAPDGSISGNTGCNNYFGKLVPTGASTPHGAGMNVTGLGMTKMYCQDTALQEQQYMNLLEKTMAYAIDSPEQVVFTTTDGNLLICNRPAAIGTTPPARY